MIVAEIFYSYYPSDEVIGWIIDGMKGTGGYQSFAKRLRECLKVEEKRLDVTEEVFMWLVERAHLLSDYYESGGLQRMIPEEMKTDALDWATSP